MAFDLSRLNPSGEYEIRQGVVSALLADGWHRDKIRLEIPLGTNSSEGRADIVLLGTEKLAAIELKSAKDKFCPKAIRAQCQQYKRFFDCVASVVDKKHHQYLEIKNKAQGWTRYDNNFRDVDFQYSHLFGHISDDGEKAMTGFSTAVFARKSYSTTGLSMANILWASEIKKIFGISTKSKFIKIAREKKALQEIRPAVLLALYERPMNEWEKAFWDKFIILEPAKEIS